MAGRAGGRGSWRAVRSFLDFRSVGAAAAQHGGNGLGEDREIEPQGPVVDVLHVSPDPVVEAERPLADLVQAGDTRLDAEATLVRAMIDAQDVTHWERTGADQAHVAAQDVHELRQLVQAELPENP